MKNTITRVLAIAMLTTSISAFAASDKARATKDTDCKNSHPEETIIISLADQPNNDNDESQSDQSDQKSEIQQQNAEWLHDLQGIYGG